MDFKTISLNMDSGVAVLLLDRPDRRNAMDDDMAGEFEAALGDVDGREDARSLVLTGAGSAFCAGGDLGGFAKWADAEPASVEVEMRLFYRRFLSILDLSIPTVAAINGPAIGAGACLAAACDVRLASETASIGFTFVGLGINPGMGAEFLLNRLVGPARAAELLLTGEVLSAKDAHRIGLIGRPVSGDQLMQIALEQARRLAALPPAVPETIKKNLAAAAVGAPLEKILAQEASTQADIFTDPSFQKEIRKIRP